MLNTERLTSSFSFKMPASLKDAARALTKVYFHEPAGDDRCNSILLRNVSDALIFLAERGLKHTLGCVDTRLSEENALLEMRRAHLDFFLENPAATEVRPANFAEDAPGARLFKELANIVTDSDGNLLPEESDEGPEAINRSEASRQFAYAQERVLKLVDAKGAIQRALTQTSYFSAPTAPEA